MARQGGQGLCRSCATPAGAPPPQGATSSGSELNVRPQALRALWDEGSEAPSDTAAVHPGPAAGGPVFPKKNAAAADGPPPRGFAPRVNPSRGWYAEGEMRRGAPRWGNSPDSPAAGKNRLGGFFWPPTRKTGLCHFRGPGDLGGGACCSRGSACQPLAKVVNGAVRTARRFQTCKELNEFARVRGIFAHAPGKKESARF